MTNCPVCSYPVADRLTSTCNNCGAELNAEDVEGTGNASPPESSEPVSESRSLPPVPPTPTGTDAPSPEEPGSSVPFEDRSSPFATRLFETIKKAFADPVALFSNIPSDGNIGPAVLYAVILGSFGTALAVLWQMVFGGVLAAMNPISPEELALQTGMMVFMVIFSPALAVLGLFIGAGIYHLMLLLLGDGNRGFNVTLRVVAYGATPQLLGIIPFCGAMIGGIWVIVLYVLGAMHGHKTEWWRALIAYLLPLVVCCCLMAGLWTFFMAIAAGNS